MVIVYELLDPFRNLAQHSTPGHGSAKHSPIQHNNIKQRRTTQSSTAGNGKPKHCTVQEFKFQYSELDEKCLGGMHVVGRIL